MTVYTLQGHPLNIANAMDSGVDTAVLHAQMQITGVGGTINITLTGAEDTKVKGHGALK